MRSIFLAAAFVALTGVNCIQPLAPWLFPTDEPIDTTPHEASLLKFTSADEMKTYLANEASEAANRNYGYYYAEDAMGSAPTGSNSSSDSTSDTSYSTTNIQEAGVDEADVIKNDGTYIYLIKDKSIRIVQAAPDALQQVGSVTLDDAPNSLYLRGDRLIALGVSGYQYGYTGGTIVTFINVADRTAPVVETTLRLDTVLASSRLIGSKLHLVLTKSRYLPYHVSTDTLKQEPLENWLPECEMTPAGGDAQTTKLGGWEDFYHPIDAQGYNLTMVTTLNVDDLTAAPQTVGITADAGTIYASSTALYVTSSDSSWWISFRPHDNTVVHKFDLRGDHAVYTGSGLVPGHLLNQYSLGEKDGYLRLGSTTGHVSPDGNSEVVNAVYVLGESATAGQLDVVGKVEGIAPGEQIYSARFVGDRGFLVTFKKVDPLYTLDLSDPTDPRVVGQLKVPGYSDYIHVMDANHLLTIGKDAYDMGGFAWYQGVQLSIFDVTNFEEPTLLAKEIIGVRGTESEASWNPKAFNYFASLDALAIPISLAEGPTSRPEQFGDVTFAGLYVYRVTVADGFQLLGRMSTVQASRYYWYSWFGAGRYTRGVFIGDNVYAVSDSQVSVAPVADPLNVTATVNLN